MFFRERAISLAAKPNSANSEEQPHALHDSSPPLPRQRYFFFFFFDLPTL